MIKNKLNFYKSWGLIFLVLSMNFGMNLFLRKQRYQIFPFAINVIVFILFLLMYMKEKRNCIKRGKPNNKA